MRFSGLATTLAGLWAGVLLAIGAVAAPAGFANAPADVAGRIAGRMFMQEAYLGLLAAVVLLFLVRAQGRRTAINGRGSVFSLNLALVLGALFCTIAGYFALQPMMADARAGQGSLSFGALHGLSAGFYVLKGVLVLVLTWRLAAAPR